MPTLLIHHAISLHLSIFPLSLSLPGLLHFLYQCSFSFILIFFPFFIPPPPPPPPLPQVLHVSVHGVWDSTAGLHYPLCLHYYCQEGRCTRILYPDNLRSEPVFSALWCRMTGFVTCNKSSSVCAPCNRSKSAIP